MQMCWGHGAVYKEGLGTNAHRCFVQMEQKLKKNSLTAPLQNKSTPEIVQQPKIWRLPRSKKKWFGDRTLMCCYSPNYIVTILWFGLYCEERYAQERKCSLCSCSWWGVLVLLANPLVDLPQPFQFVGHRRKHLRRWRRTHLHYMSANPPTSHPFAFPTLDENLCVVYGTFRTCAPHVYGSMCAHSAPQVFISALN